MGAVDWSSIEAKVKAFSETSDGKERMQQAVRTMKKSGKSHTSSGYELLSEERMRILANELLDMIRMEAASSGLPGSVMFHFDSLTYAVAGSLDGDVEFHVYFEDDMSRPSLVPDLYDGIDNIVALFNNGYVASDRVYGYWSSYTYGTRKVASRQYRQGAAFIQSAVESFLNKYAGRYNVTIEIGDEYSGGLFSGEMMESAARGI